MIRVPVASIEFPCHDIESTYPLRRITNPHRSSPTGYRIISQLPVIITTPSPSITMVVNCMRILKPSEYPAEGMTPTDRHRRTLICSRGIP